MGPLYVVDAGCALTVADPQFEQSTDGIVERAHLTVESIDGTCHDIGVRLPPDVWLGERSARIVMSDDTRRKLGASRWVTAPDDASGEFPLHPWDPPGLYGYRIAHLLVPELLKRDRVELDVERVWPVDRAIAWGIAPDLVVAPSAGAPRAVIASSATEPPPVRTRRSMTFRIPDGDVQTSLYPGGKAVADVVDEVTFPATTAARPWWIPIPDDATDPRVTVEPADVGDVWVRRPDGIAVDAPVSDDLLTVTIAYTLPDPPACGEEHGRPGETFEFEPSDPGGHVRSGDVFWSLADHDGQPVLPDRESVVRGLGSRFDAVSIPEPALPIGLKGHVKNEELLTLLRPTLWSRAHVAELPGDPLFPRKLYAARRSEVVTPIEAALILRVYALQAQIPATWVLVRPADRGAGDAICPVGYDDALLRVVWDDQVRWIDPGCPSCGPYEIRPNLLGADALGPDAVKTPDPVAGSVAVRIDADQATVRLDGPEALALRMVLEGAPKSDRERLIAERYGGSGAKLVSIDGLADAGTPITVVIRAPSGGFGDLLALGDRPMPYETGVRWVDAPGVRSVDRAASGSPGLTIGSTARMFDDGAGKNVEFGARIAAWSSPDAPIAVDLSSLTYARTATDGRVVETVEIVDRRVPDDDITRLAAVRAAHALPVGAPAAFAAITSAPTPFAPLRAGAPASLPASAAVVVEAHNSAVAVARTVGDVAAIGRVATADLRALPCRATFIGKKQTTILVDHPFAATVAARIPTAGEAVWIVEIRDGWARIDVDGPASAVHHGGWIPLTDVKTVDSDDPIALGDVPIANWAPVVGTTARTVAITTPVTVRGLVLPAGTAIEVADSGLFTAIVTGGAESLGGVVFPAMTRLALSERCAFETATACYAVASDGQLTAR